MIKTHGNLIFGFLYSAVLLKGKKPGEMYLICIYSYVLNELFKSRYHANKTFFVLCIGENDFCQLPFTLFSQNFIFIDDKCSSGINAVWGTILTILIV